MVETSKTSGSTKGHCGFAVLFRQDTPTSLSANRHALPETSCTAAHGAESRRGWPFDQLRPEPYHFVILMTLYSTGLRRAELCRLKVSDVDSARIVTHARQGKA
ncbi:MAG: hypothetical protein DMG15_17695 [Acidobacteria bacterium]|nr:MAG: hypothetical protein DMG16_02945 [Acidobacteriota bacterium]PYS11474.1 MAG: hypothetical protein DMG15_17695 [Acidobacteriota bacterium]